MTDRWYGLTAQVEARVNGVLGVYAAVIIRVLPQDRVVLDVKRGNGAAIRIITDRQNVTARTTAFGEPIYDLSYINSLNDVGSTE